MEKNMYDIEKLKLVYETTKLWPELKKDKRKSVNFKPFIYKLVIDLCKYIDMIQRWKEIHDEINKQTFDNCPYMELVSPEAGQYPLVEREIEYLLLKSIPFLDNQVEKAIEFRDALAHGLNLKRDVDNEYASIEDMMVTCVKLLIKHHFPEAT